MAESGVIYTCPDDFLEGAPSLMARAGIAVKELPSPEHGEGCERAFAVQLSRDKGTVELSGFYFVKENRFILGFGWGRNPLRWYWDEKLSAVVKELLMDNGMIRVSTGTGTDSASAEAAARQSLSDRRPRADWFARCSSLDARVSPVTDQSVGRSNDAPIKCGINGECDVPCNDLDAV